jgi:hypothetical protein
MGGYMASIAKEEAIKYVDSVVVGDAEISFLKMLEDFEKHEKLEPFYDYPISKLENLPVPRYDLLMNKPIGDMLPVQAGRGCTFTCSFCSIACLYEGKYLFRPVDEVIRDIKAVKDLGFNRFYLIDDNIVSNPSYLKELCEKITPLKMHWASQCALHLAKKPDLLKLVVKLPIPRFYILTPIPGTALFKQFKEQGRLLTEDLKEFNGAQCVHIPDKISPENLTRMYWWLNNQIFSVKSIFHRVLLNKYLWRNPKMLLFSIGVNLHYRHYVRKKVTPNIF